MTDPKPWRRHILELIALTSDTDRQRAKLAIFFPTLDPDATLAHLAEYRHRIVWGDGAAAQQIIDGIIQQDTEGKT
jgi:hypothetical protein